MNIFTGTVEEQYPSPITSRIYMQADRKMFAFFFIKIEKQYKILIRKIFIAIFMANKTYTCIST